MVCGDLAPDYEISHKFFCFREFPGIFFWLVLRPILHFHRSLARCPTISADQVCQVNMFENTKKKFFGAIFYLDLNKTCKKRHLRLGDILLTCFNPLGRAVGSVSFALSKCLYI